VPESLTNAERDHPSRAVPAWFQDAKLGIFVRWGAYSVPAGPSQLVGWAQLMRPSGPGTTRMPSGSQGAVSARRVQALCGTVR